MNTRRLLALSAIILVTPTLVLAQFGGPAQGAYGMQPVDPGTFNNVIGLSLGAPNVDGSAAYYMQRYRTPESLFGGIEMLHYESFVGDDGILTLDGKAIPGNDEYRADLKLEVLDKGFIKGSIDQFKVRYDGLGGYLEPIDLTFLPRDRELAMDRGDYGFEAGLRIPDLPAITVRYTHRFRDGTKPSLSWGDSYEVGELNRKNIVPSFWLSDEKRDIFDASVEHTMGKTTVSVSGGFETGDISNKLNVWRRPGESAERFLTDNEAGETSANHFRISSSTRLSDNARFSAFALRHEAETDVYGDRIYGADFGAPFSESYPNAQRRDHGFIDLDGTTSRTAMVAGASFSYRFGDVTLIPSLRYEDMELDGDVTVTDTNIERDGSMTRHPLANSATRSATDLMGSLELRFTGIDNLTLYARGDLLDRTGDVYEQELETDTGSEEFTREAEETKSAFKIMGGLNWRPTSKVRLSGQVYHRTRSIEYDHIVNADGPLTYPGFLQAQDFETLDMNASLRVQPDPRVTLSVRFDWRESTTDGTGGDLGTYRSATIDSQTLTAVAHFVPTSGSYVQLNLTSSEFGVVTPINEMTGDVANIVPEARSDYLTFGVNAGTVVTDRLDVDGSVFYLKSDNFVDNYAVGHPYQISLEEQGFSAGMRYQVNEQLTGSLKGYYFINRDDTFGGNQDFDVIMVYAGVAYRF